MAVALLYALGANQVLFLFTALTAAALRNLPLGVRALAILVSLCLFAVGVVRIATNST